MLRFCRRSMDLKYYKIWFYLGITQVIVMIYLSLISHPPAPMTFNQVDKLYHLLAYSWLAVWFVQLYRVERYLILGLCLVLLGIVVEILQAFSATRLFEFVDILADAMGVLIGIGLGYTRVRLSFHTIERLLP